MLNYLSFLYIELKYPVKTKWIAADFSEGVKAYEHIQKELAGIPVGILGLYYYFLTIYIVPWCTCVDLWLIMWD